MAYHKLRGSSSIRLLELQPASLEDPDKLDAHLIEIDLTNAPPFEALSYTWGAPLFDQTIRFDNGSLQITQNLASALRAFRLSTSRLVWADQICINQADDAERSQQVALMDQIYTKTVSVLVWLGDKTGATSHAIDAMKFLAQAAKLCGVHEIKDAHVKHDLAQSTDQQKEIMQKLVDEYDFTKLRAIYSMPWFSRLWIIQEICLPRKVTLHCGNDKIDLEPFGLATAFILRIDSYAKTKFPMASMISSAIDIVTLRESRIKRATPNAEGSQSQTFNPREWMPAWDGLNLLDFVSSLSRNRECTDKRDLVYGLLSLRAESDITLQPDYSKTIIQVYTEFAREYLLKQEVRILHYAGLSNNLSSTNTPSETDVSELPSWAADWRVSRRIQLGGGNKVLFTAGDGINVKVKAEGDGYTINLTCILIDTIGDGRAAEIGGFDSQKPLNYTFEDSRKSIISLKAYFDADCGTGSYQTGETQTMAFARTIIGDFATTGLDFMKLLLKDHSNKTELLNLWLMFEKIGIKKDGALDLDPKFCLPSLVPDHPYTRPQTVYLAWLYMTSLAAILKRRKLFLSDKKYVGLAPNMCMKGDLLVIIGGCQAPFAVRFDENRKAYRLIGECYLHGYMNQELLGNEYRQLRLAIF
ncbi:Heterokaryon incompatibility protein 6 OR allele [Lachnellula suecica]|uniref:Heterokaryon incompatibility protein 6 OR allele n=1 Tax=Lachnellula suecica TaxID=602035 RepID=A0A8T9CAW6_9HELO|nr:Heterokaryon incompatibility protein 6 OR allele [Lachnellula suecica]